MEQLSETTLRVRAPARLTRALDAEAERLLLTRSALIRCVLAERLGLYGESQQARREAGQQAGG